MALELSEWLRPLPSALAVAVLLDVVLGDPPYRLHPVRLIGATLTGLENAARRHAMDGYVGGIWLFLTLATFWVVVLAALVVWTGWFGHVFVVYSLLALGDLLRHVWRVERALGVDDLPGARAAIAHLVGRDTAPMDAAACRRAAIESLSENLTDGFTSPLFWYALGGIPGLVLFKVVSTMDSMVGYKTPRYLRFGWCGARLDDVMNVVPARLTWLAIAMVASILPSCSGPKALAIGFAQHAILPGPNSGWSEAAAAGGIQRRLVGPIWVQGQLVTDAWLGDPADPPAGTRDDVVRAIVLVASTGIAAAIVAAIVITW